MVRRKPLEKSRGKPEGPRWSAYRKQLIAQWARQGRTCFYCGHPFAAPGLIEVCHLISKLVRPDLAWDRDNLVPGHGRNAGRYGNRRCPECQLNCNWIAAVNPNAPKDPATGADLPFSPQFIAEQIAELRNSGRNSKPGLFEQNSPKPGGGSKTPPITVSHPEGVGREW